jgi:hypothetical protein
VGGQAGGAGQDLDGLLQEQVHQFVRGHRDRAARLVGALAAGGVAPADGAVAGAAGRGPGGGHEPPDR